MEDRMRLHRLLIPLMLLTIASQTAGQDPRGRDDDFKVRQEYDKRNDTTTVQVGPMTIMGNFWQIPEYRLSAFYTYPGRQPSRPTMITLAIDTVTKREGRWDLQPQSYLHFIIDGIDINFGAMKLIDS